MSTAPGGPAFPFNILDEEGGMSLRDYFAGQELGGILAAGNDGSREDFAEDAYGIADAMLAARPR